MLKSKKKAKEKEEIKSEEKVEKVENYAFTSDIKEVAFAHEGISYRFSYPVGATFNHLEGAIDFLLGIVKENKKQKELELKEQLDKSSAVDA